MIPQESTVARVIAVNYGWEDPASDPRFGSLICCWCGEVNELFLVGDRFFCALHRPNRPRR